MKTIAIYARVSTKNQKPDIQLRDLRRYAKSRGWKVSGEYVDRGESGTKASRPELNLLMADVRKGKVRGVLVWKFDRFARSLAHLVNTLSEFQEKGMAFVSYREAIDTSTTARKVAFHLFGLLAELERDMIADRVRAGLETARANGKRLGRPPATVDRDEIRRAYKEKGSLRGTAAELGISKDTVSRKLGMKKQ